MVTIIGGGPIGCYAAALLSKHNDVTLYEENEEIGIPIQCTGILSNTITSMMKLKKDFIAYKVYGARIYSPNNKFVNINFKQPNIIVYRNKFDQHFRDIALKNGAKIIHKHRYNNDEIINIETREKTKLKYDKLIGADGPLSKVSNYHGLGQRTYLQGVQALIKKKNDGKVDFFPHIGTYAWAVPQSESVLRVGVAAPTNAMNIYKEFSKLYKGKLLGWQGGLIPLHDPKITAQKENIYLVGDAAAQIKNTTGGGLIPGLMCAEELNKAITNNLNYDKLWKKRVGKKLWAHDFVRTVFNRFTEQDWNKLVEISNSDSMVKILGKESRDEPIKILLKACAQNPSLLLFLRRLLV